MCHKSQATAALWDMSQDIGVPVILVKDGAKEMGGDDWLQAVCQLTIEEHILEAYHQNLNLVEQRGGDVKLALLHFYCNTPDTPLNYW